MVWTLKKIAENENTITIGYSYENNRSCDGIIIYDKKTHENSLKKISPVQGENTDFSRFVGEKAFQFIHGLLRDKKLTEKPYVIYTG